MKGSKSNKLFDDIVKIIEHARSSVASAVNSGMTLMYWHIGKAINDDVLNGKRAEYGKQVVENLSVQLQQKYGTKEFFARSLRRMMQFSQEIDFQIVSTVLTKLSWTHFLLVLPLKDEVQRDFYLTMASAEHWNKRELQVDLLFYRRKLHRMIAVDLKLGKFKAEYKGQMELYLRYLDKYEKEDGEDSPLGLFLCSEGSSEKIELLQLDESGIKVCQYMTELPDKQILIDELRKQRELLENNASLTDESRG